MILECPKCHNQFKPIKFRTAPDGVEMVECLSCNFVFPVPGTEPVKTGTKPGKSAPAGIPKVEFVEPNAISAKPQAPKVVPDTETETDTTVADKDISRQDSAPASPQADTTDRKHKIMVVDDTLFFRKVLTDLFEENGYEVIAAVDGVDAVTKLKKEHESLDLLLLDLQLPKMSGFEVLDNIQRTGICRNLPILIITGIHQKAEEVRLVKKLGATGYISKANPPEYFLFRVNQLLNPSKAEWVDPS